MNLESALIKVENVSEKCLVQKWLDNLGADDHHLLWQKFHEGYPVNRLWRASQLIGNKSSSASFARHFRKECSCKRP